MKWIRDTKDFLSDDEVLGCGCGGCLVAILLIVAAAIKLALIAGVIAVAILTARHLGIPI